jgi:hypothetical protein
MNLSDQVGKQFDGLVRFNGNKTFSASLVAQIKEQNIAEHILTNLHKDLVGVFAVFLQKFWAAGSYSQDILSRLWQLCLSQHPSVIGNF